MSSSTRDLPQLTHYQHVSGCHVTSRLCWKWVLGCRNFSSVVETQRSWGLTMAVMVAIIVKFLFIIMNRNVITDLIYFKHIMLDYCMTTRYY